MKKISLFILSAFLVSALSSKSVQAQSTCNGTLFGIPVCTGFCVDTKQDDPKKKQRIKELRQKADSLNKEANTLSDSLRGDNDLYQPHNQVWGTTETPQGFDHFFTPQIPSVPQGPDIQVLPFDIPGYQDKNPMKNFDGWYIKKLETAELVK